MHPNDLFSGHQHLSVVAFTDCLRACHDMDPGLWGLTQASRTHLRLNFGSLVVAALFHGVLWVIVPAGEDNYLDGSKNWYWTPQWDPKAVPSRSGFYLPLTNHRRAWKNIRERHGRSLGVVSEKYRVLRKNSARAHSEEALKTLEFELRKTLPRPERPK